MGFSRYKSILFISDHKIREIRKKVAFAIAILEEGIVDILSWLMPMRSDSETLRYYIIDVQFSKYMCENLMKLEKQLRVQNLWTQLVPQSLVLLTLTFAQLLFILCGLVTWHEH